MPIRARLTDFRDVEQALTELCAGFAANGCATVPCQTVSPDAMPQRFQQLLVHHDHMTVRLEAFYGRKVALRVLDHHHKEPIYHRRIVLVLEGSGEVVEFGVVRIDFRYVPDGSRLEILERSTPLGEILIRHDLLRRIEPRWYLRIPMACPHLACFGSTRSGDAYGRVGTIYCNGEPAIELLEVVADTESPRPPQTDKGVCEKLDAPPSRDREGAVDKVETGPLPYGRGSETTSHKRPKPMG